MAIPRSRWLVAGVIVITFLLWSRWSSSSLASEYDHTGLLPPDFEKHPVPDPDPNFFWRRIKTSHPVESFRPLPAGPPQSSPPLPRVQAASFGGGGFSSTRATRLARRKAVRETFSRAWDSYKMFAWLRDEVTPITGQKRDPFGGWGATLIDSLDTLWIMGMRREFEIAVAAVDRDISFETTGAREVNVFETTIRFLGGLIAAYELSGDGRLLAKARDAGDMLYAAFDTPNRLPVTRWDIRAARQQGTEAQAASADTLLAELGSLSMEFTRLSQLTGDPKYFDAVQRIGELLAAAQDKTKIPGLWPVHVDAAAQDFDVGSEYSLGGMADSTYEYLPKMVALLGDTQSIYGDMYLKSMRAAREHLLYRPMTPKGDDVLFFGNAQVTRTNGKMDVKLDTEATHLTCFAGGMLALGGRLFADDEHLAVAGRLTRGCVWAYASTPTGVMPELAHLQACPSPDGDPCPWSDARWHEGVIARSSRADVKKTVADERLPPGFTSIPDRRYILRPEAVESVFVMYRVTGDAYWQDRAWDMWLAIDRLTTCELANSAVADVCPRDGEAPAKMDSMESFWMGETLKYFYLIFSEPELVSLDEWVFNTEAHPFRRWTGAKGA